MGHVLTDIGEEYTIKTNLDAATVSVGLYNDTTDAITDTDDYDLSTGAITTEPSDGNYATQTGEAVSASDESGNWGVITDSDVVFDVTSTTGTVDSYFVVVSFQSTDAGDGSPANHLVCTGALSQSYDLSNLTALTISAGGVGWTVN